MALIVFVVCV